MAHDPSSDAPPGRTKIRIVVLVVLLATLAASALVGGVAAMRRARLGVGAETTVRVDPGDSLASLAARLDRLRVIPSGLAFRLLGRMRGLDSRLRAGDYPVDPGTSVAALIERLAAARPITVSVTIPEGLTVLETASRLEQAGLGNLEDYRCLAESADLAAELDLPGGGLEGYLFPDTYVFEPSAAPRVVVQRMVERFFEVFDAGLVATAASRGLRVDEAVTLASLIEEEAAVDEERGLISAVFRNRLALGMPLQSDPTARYGVAGSGPITRADLRRATPYNTYVIRGLPPGPISNPGRASLVAAVRPAADARVLFFVARDDRTHEFNATLEGHERAVRHWRRGGR